MFRPNFIADVTPLHLALPSLQATLYTGAQWYTLVNTTLYTGAQWYNLVQGTLYTGAEWYNLVQATVSL